MNDIKQYLKETNTVLLTRETFEYLKSLEPKTGHWIECEDEVKVYCSECKVISDYPTNYCPNCGARMVEPQERSDDYGIPESRQLL